MHPSKHSNSTWRLIAVAVLATLPNIAAASPIRYYGVYIAQFNESGMAGRALFIVDNDADMLTVNIRANGLAPVTPHPQHAV